MYLKGKVFGGGRGRIKKGLAWETGSVLSRVVMGILTEKVTFKQRHRT